jgi:hypothetical protein
VAGRITAYVAVTLAGDLSLNQLITVEAEIEDLVDRSIPAVAETVVRALMAKPRPTVRLMPQPRREKEKSRVSGGRWGRRS